MSIIRREKSRIGMYHVLAQGAGNNELFHDDEDYQVSAIMQSISQLYSRYYSSKYNSYGPLYRRRYYSEPINDDERMEVVMRYVHQEPLRLGMAEALDEWAWSSWHEYVGLESDLPIVCKKPDACHNLTDEQWRELLSRPLPEGTKCLEPKEYRAPKPTETQVLGMVRLMTTATTWDEFKTISRDEKLKTIKQLLQNGASIRQMEKLTGIGRGVILGSLRIVLPLLPYPACDAMRCQGCLLISHNHSIFTIFG